jgi:hypothetical protein
MATAQPAPALVLAPGSRVTRLGVCGDPLPRVTLPAAEIPLHAGPAAAASALMLASAQHLSLPSSALAHHTLVVVEPPVSFPRNARDALSQAALGLLHMPRVVFVPAASAIALAARADGRPHVIVDVGWAATRVLIGGYVVAVAAVGLRDVSRLLHDSIGALPDGFTDMDEVRACSCFFNGISITSDTVVGDVSHRGQVIVPAQLRHSAPEVLFDAEDGNWR